MSNYKQTPRNTITRLAKRGTYDRNAIHAILDEGLFCTIGFSLNGQSLQIPTGYVRIDDELIIHGSVGSHYMRALSESQSDVSIGVTLIDGLVLARSAFHHSVNYRSVVLFAKPKKIEARTSMLMSLEAFTNKMVPGRWNDVRVPSESELKKTLMLSFTIEEASAKIRSGPPNDDPEDYALPTWAGVVPLRTLRIKPIRDPKLNEGIPLPGYLEG